MTDLLTHFGYLAIFVGTFFEGEIIMVLGGFAAHQGHLDLGLVVAAGFLGSCLGDQLWFVLGRRYGRALLERRPGLARRAAQVTRRLERNATLFILVFRFLYGLRIAGPIAIALAGVPLRRFAVLNALAAAVWAVAVGAAGFLFGAAAERLLGDIQTIEQRLVVAAVLAAFLAFGLYRLHRWMAPRRERTDPR